MAPSPGADSPPLDRQPRSQSAARLAVTAKPPSLSEEEEPEHGLCCCEYVNMHGERSHAAVPCCDCEHLDEAFDRWLRRRPQEPESVSRLLAVVSDRARIPWLWGGARKVDPSAVAPLVLLPALLHVAALHVLLLAVVVLAALPGVLAWFYTRQRRKGRTRFFLSLTLCSVGYTCYVFVTEVCPRGDVGSARSAAFATGMILGLLALAHTRKDPGAVRPSRGDVPDRTLTSSRIPSPEMEVAFSGATVTKWADLRGSEQTKAGAERTEQGGDDGGGGGRKDWWCEACAAPRPPRAGHCRTCGVCVLRLDHHCVWIDGCVGQANHRSFLLTLLLFLSASLYGIGLSLRSVCPRRRSLLTALLHCPGVFRQHATALVFACAWYGSVVAAGLLCLLLVQVVNISHNVTLREAGVARRARERANEARIGCWGLVVDAGVHSRGLRRNWLEFMTMGDDLYASYVLPD